MPAVPVQSEHPIVGFARELDALMKRYDGLVEPADLAVCLQSSVAAILGSYGEREAFDALREYFGVAAKLKMAKASLES